MFSDQVIQVESLSKAYQVYRHPRDRLKQALIPRAVGFARRLRGAGVGPGPLPRYYSDFWALRDVGLHVRRGESVGIIGGNGAGKSTLLQIIAGTLLPTSGSVRVVGRVAALLELGSGFNPEFTGRENVMLNGSILGLTPREITTRFDDIAAFADIGDFIDQPVKTYSSGMLVRLAFAVQAHVEPDVLIVDEALSVGDVRFTLKCVRHLRALRERGTSVLFVSHDLASVVNFCDRAIWLSHGTVRMTGDPKAVTIAYYNHMTYGDSPVAGDSGVFDGLATRPAGVETGDDLLGHAVELVSPPAHSTGALRARRLLLWDTNSRQPKSIVEGGEFLELMLEFDCSDRVTAPIVAAHLYDRKGNLVFGLNNSFLDFAPRELSPGRHVFRFTFRMPHLMAGDYAWSLGVADGSYDDYRNVLTVNEAAVLHVAAGRLSQNHYLISLDDVGCRQE